MVHLTEKLAHVACIITHRYYTSLKMTRNTQNSRAQNNTPKPPPSEFKVLTSNVRKTDVAETTQQVRSTTAANGINANAKAERLIVNAAVGGGVLASKLLIENGGDVVKTEQQLEVLDAIVAVKRQLVFRGKDAGAPVRAFLTKDTIPVDSERTRAITLPGRVNRLGE